MTSRYFAPAWGIPEDPVTGSADSRWPFLAQAPRPDAVVAISASRRGGIVDVEAWGERVGLAGRAVTVLEGRLLDLGGDLAGRRERRGSSCAARPRREVPQHSTSAWSPASSRLAGRDLVERVGGAVPVEG